MKFFIGKNPGKMELRGIFGKKPEDPFQISKKDRGADFSKKSLGLICSVFFRNNPDLEGFLNKKYLVKTNTSGIIF